MTKVDKINSFWFEYTLKKFIFQQVKLLFCELTVLKLQSAGNNLLFWNLTLL